MIIREILLKGEVQSALWKEKKAPKNCDAQKKKASTKKQT